MTPRIKNMTAGCTGDAATLGPTIAAGFVRGLMELAVAKGAARDELIRRSAIDPAQLGDADNRVPYAQYVALMRAGKELCNDPALALHFGEAFECAEMSIVGLIGRASENLAEGFAQLNRYARLASDVELEGGPASERFQLSRRDGELWLIDTRKNPNDFPEHTESTFARMVSTSRRNFGAANFMQAVHVTHAEPSYRAEYERVFQMPVTFGSDRNAVLLAGDSWMETRTQHASRYVRDVLSARAETLLERLERSKTTRGRVENLLLPLLHTREANVDAVAAKLGLSRQTLFRKLKAEGVTFEKVLNELRHAMALRYLSGDDASVNRTAYLVGFSDPAAFSRAFKRWTGSCPRAMLASKSEQRQTTLYSPPATR